LPKELTDHCLRHTNANLLISHNVDICTVASLLGHAQPSTTLNIYTYAFDSTKRAASERLMVPRVFVLQITPRERENPA
jgi:integrase